MAKPSKQFVLASLSMAILFAYSASVQLNDPDWYFWFPLYAIASFANLTNCALGPSTRNVRLLCKVALGTGLSMFCKAVMEDFKRGIAGIWSLNISERVVRERTGSFLVIASVALHLESSNNINQGSKKWVDIAMIGLVGISYALPFVFFVVQEGTLKY